MGGQGGYHPRYEPPDGAHANRRTIYQLRLGDWRLQSHTRRRGHHGAHHRDRQASSIDLGVRPGALQVGGVGRRRRRRRRGSLNGNRVLRIPCPFCGFRDEPEFIFGGPSHITRPAPEVDDAAWTEYLFARDNPGGMHYERWLPAHGGGG